MQAALGPKRVLATLDLQRRAGANVTVEDFAVVADLLDDVVGPVVRHAEIGTDLGAFFSAKQTLDIRVGAVLLLVDVFDVMPSSSALTIA